MRAATEAKSNEITAIPELLDLIEPGGATVTLDAMACQRDIAGKLVERGAAYVLALDDTTRCEHRRELLRSIPRRLGGDWVRDAPRA